MTSVVQCARAIVGFLEWPTPCLPGKTDRSIGSEHSRESTHKCAHSHTHTRSNHTNNEALAAAVLKSGPSDPTDLAVQEEMVWDQKSNS